MARLFPDNTLPENTSIAMRTTNGNAGINTPPEENFNTQAMQGSLQQFLADNLGQYVLVEFLIGTQNIEHKAGILYAVGRSVLTLFEEQSQTFVVCDMFSVKFVTFFMPGRRPERIPGPATRPNSGSGYSPSDFGEIIPGAGGGVIFSGVPGVNTMGGSRNGMGGMNSANTMNGMSGMNSANTMNGMGGMNSANSMNGMGGMNSANTMNGMSGMNSANSMNGMGGMNSANSMNGMGGMSGMR